MVTAVTAILVSALPADMAAAQAKSTLPAAKAALTDAIMAKVVAGEMEAGLRLMQPYNPGEPVSADQALGKIQQTLDSQLGVKTRRVTKQVLSQRMGYLIAGGPPPGPTFTTEVVEERTEQWSKLVGVLFCIPGSELGRKEVVPKLDYFHHRSGLFVDFFCIGYSATAGAGDASSQAVAVVKDVQWRFSAGEFNACRAQLEKETKWRFSGETDLLLAVARKPNNALAYLDYSCAIACNLEAMARDGAIDSVGAFFEKIFQFGEHYTGDDPVWKLSDKFGIAAGGELLTEAVLSLLPEQVRKRYKSARHFAIRDASVARS